jgi:hypothetical protein
MGFENFHIFARNPWVLAYGFTKNWQFRAKTDQNTVFLGHDSSIASQLSITVPYFNFYGFWKFSHFCSKSNGVTENFQFGAKTDRNSVFIFRDPRIVNRLSITVPYFNFHGFWKFSHFCSKSMGVSLRFDQKLPVRGKNWSKLCISRSWPPYCESIIYNGPVFQFLRVWKFSHFCSKSKCVSQRFYRKLPVRGKNWPKLRISWSWPPYCESVIYNGPVFQFSRVLKIFTFLLEIQKC